MYYSKTTGCVYFENIHGRNIPADAIKISRERYEEVIANPPRGKIRDHDADGLPILVDSPASALTANDLKGRITRYRWSIETGSLTLSNGVQVATGIDDQNRITSVIANARLANLDTVSFKATNGWVTLTLAELEGVAAAIAMHVQACFSAERAHHEAIDALEQLHGEDDQALQQALVAYDIESGWPTNDLQTPQPA